MKSFSSKTRYNIRLAGKKGVTVKEDNSDKAFERYLELTSETVSRQGFYAHTEKYHRLNVGNSYKKPELPIFLLLLIKVKLLQPGYFLLGKTFFIIPTVPQPKNTKKLWPIT